MTYFSDTRTAPSIHRSRPTLSQMLAVWKQRRQLRAMDDRALADIGLSRQDALSEAQRPMWDVPGHWLR